MADMYMFETRTATQKAIAANTAIFILLYAAYKQEASISVLIALAGVLVVIANGAIIYISRRTR